MSDLYIVSTVDKIIQDFQNIDTEKFDPTRLLKPLDSIARKSKNAILQFPVLVSDTISLENLTMVSKALEREYATFVRVAMGLDDIVHIGNNDETAANTKLRYVNKFHQNLDRNFYVESLEIKNIKYDLKRINMSSLQNVYKEDFNTDSLNSKTNKNLKKDYIISEVIGSSPVVTPPNERSTTISKHDIRAGLSDEELDELDIGRHIQQMEIDDSKESREREKHTYEQVYDYNKDLSTQVGIQKSRAELEKLGYDVTQRITKELHDRNKNIATVAGTHKSQAELDKLEYEAKQRPVEELRSKEKHDMSKEKHKSDLSYQQSYQKLHDIQKEKTDKEISKVLSELNKRNYDKQLVDNDVKKSNELVPTLLNIEINIKPEKGHAFLTNILIGIKTVAHLISSNDMIYNLTQGVLESRLIFRTVQWLTGEISFVKDYLLTLDQIKRSSLQTREGSHWWKMLRNRAFNSKIKRLIFSRGLLPNATLVITMEEVEYMKNNLNINLLKDIKSVQKLFETYFLLGLVVVDAGSEVCHFLFDGDTSYQMFSFNSLEREGKGSGGEVKSLINLMSRMR